jgi:FKBP-type peptidyl-prolyl cis-trans isomerase FkpA
MECFVSAVPLARGRVRAASSQPASRAGPALTMRLSRRAAVRALAGLSLALPLHAAGAYSSTYAPSKAQGGKEAVDEPRLYDAKAVVTTSSGLRYFDLSVGTEGPAVRAGDAVNCAYTTRLGGLYGLKLDSSFDNGRDLKFTVGDPKVVPGVAEMVLGMRVGGKRRAVIPPALGYKDASGLPAITDFFAKRRLLSVLDTNRDATIVIDLEVLRVRHAGS